MNNKLNGYGLYQLSDEQLMHFVAGDRYSAFKLLIARYKPMVLRHALRMLDQRSKAREVSKEVFLTVWSDRKKHRPQGQFRKYLATLTQDLCRTRSGTQMIPLARINTAV